MSDEMDEVLKALGSTGGRRVSMDELALTPTESHQHGVIEASGATREELFDLCKDRIEEIENAVGRIPSMVAGSDRDTLARTLANLNAAAMHTRDYTGC